MIEKQKRVLAIHDISCVGRCSLTVALPILSVAGFDTSVLPTAILSTHTGAFQGYTYRDLTDDIPLITKHWQSLHLRFDALYSGFLGSFRQFEPVGALFDLFRKEDTLVLVDPVMADNGKLYAVYSQEMVDGMRKLCAKADLLVPNRTEAAFLLDEAYTDAADQSAIERTLKKLSGLGPKRVVLTGVSFEPDKLGAACYDSATGAVGYAFCDRAEGAFHGTGDLFGSVLLSALLRGFSLCRATKIAVDYTRRCITHTLWLAQERRYGVCFEPAIPYLLELLTGVAE